MSSASNFALSGFIAANVTATGFGAFTIVYGVYNIVVGLSAGLVSIPLIVRYSAATPERSRAATRASVGGALIVGAVGGICCIAVTPLVSPSISAPLLALGAALPGLLAQDAWRYSFMATGRPARAAVNDGVWTGLQLVAVIALLTLHDVTALSMVVVWGGSATAAAAVGCWQARTTPAPRAAFGWLREHHGLAIRYALEILLQRSGIWLSLTLVAAVAGLRVVGALRGALLLLGGPLNLLFVGASFALIPEGVRLLHRSPELLPRAVRGLSAAGVAIAATWCGVVLALTSLIGPSVLGATWPQAKPLLPLLVLMMLSLAASLGAVQGLIALGAANRSLFTQSLSVAVDAPAMIVGAIIAGAPGAAVATSITSLFRTAVGWVQFRRALRERNRVPASDLGRQVPQAATG